MNCSSGIAASEERGQTAKPGESQNESLDSIRAAFPILFASHPADRRTRENLSANFYFFRLVEQFCNTLLQGGVAARIKVSQICAQSGC